MNRSDNTSAVAVFVKTPGLSPIKTRLAAGLGQACAEEWHRRAAACVAQVVHAAGLPGHWAIAEAEALAHSLWGDLPRLAQGSGSLGQRMARIHRALLQQHPAAVLLGADLPQLEARHLQATADWLNMSGPRAVLGPARDGGFWLFGANRLVPEVRWTAVAYSQADTAQAFRAALGDEFSWLELEILTDLDTAEDLGRVHAELDRIAEPLPGQIEIRDWLSIVAGIEQLMNG